MVRRRSRSGHFQTGSTGQIEPDRAVKLTGIGIKQINVLDSAIVEYEIVDMVVVDLAGFFDDAVAGLVQPGFRESRPLRV